MNRDVHTCCIILPHCWLGSWVSVQWEGFQENRKFWKQCGVAVVFIIYSRLVLLSNPAVINWNCPKLKHLPRNRKQIKVKFTSMMHALYTVSAVTCVTSCKQWLTHSLPWCRLKLANENAKFETPKPVFVVVVVVVCCCFFALARERTFTETYSIESRCNMTGKYTVYRHVRASFSPEMLQAWAVKGLNPLHVKLNNSYLLPHCLWYSSSIPLLVASSLTLFSLSSLSLRCSDIPCSRDW